jgi:hypothetical protein
MHVRFADTSVTSSKDVTVEHEKLPNGDVRMSLFRLGVLLVAFTFATRAEAADFFGFPAPPEEPEAQPEAATKEPEPTPPPAPVTPQAHAAPPTAPSTPKA